MIHDWTRVEAGIFHAFHHSWIEEIARCLNRGLLPDDYYALPEQHAAGFGPDVLTLQEASDDTTNAETSDTNGVALAPPRLQPIAETDMAFYRRKQKNVTVRHVSGDRIVAMVEIVSPGNKASKNDLRAFVRKAAELLSRRIHLLIVDVHRPGPRDPDGIHGEIWREITGTDFKMPGGKVFTAASYESDATVRAYVEHRALGQELPDMPLFVAAEKAVEVPLQKTYSAAFAETPRRWRRVLET